MQSLVGETIMTSDYEYALFNENADVWYTEIELKKQMDEECIDEDEVWVMHLNPISERSELIHT